MHAYLVMQIVLHIIGIPVAIFMDESDSSAAENFNCFIHVDKLPGVAINPAYDLIDVFINANLSHFGAKGMHILA